MAQELSLDGVVGICQSCMTLCTEKTRRMVEDSGLKPYGFGWQVEANAQRNREEALDQCLEACNRVKGVCPTEDKIRQFHTSPNESATSSDVVSPEHIRRCETTVNSFVAVLHALAHRPTRVDFEEKEGDQRKHQAASLMPGPKASPSRYGAPSGMLPPPGWDSMTPEQQERVEKMREQAMASGSAASPMNTGLLGGSGGWLGGTARNRDWQNTN